MQIKYDINALNFMNREHAICVFSNTIFRLKVVNNTLPFITYIDGLFYLFYYFGFRPRPKLLRP
jgi:hypothetical protein